MLKLTIRGLASRKLRSILSAIAILLGVAMISGTYVLTDQITTAFDDIFSKANAGTDVVVSKRPAFDSDQQDAGPLPDSIVAAIAGVDGVEKAEGQIFATGSLVVDGEKVEGRGGPSFVFSNTQEPFNPNEVTEGQLPTEDGTVAVDQALASNEDLSVGQQVQLTTRAGLQDVRIVGIFRFAASSIGGTSIVVTTLRDAQRWFDREGEVSIVNVEAAQGVTPEQLRDRIAPVVGPDVKVQTGLENAEEQAEAINEGIGSFLTPALLTFAIVGVLVGAFVIFNTLSITVAQRTRELGLLRSIGASRRQVLTSVMLEALFIGALASIAGLFLGIGFAQLLNVLFEAIGIDLPTASPELQPRTIAIALIVGIVVTLISALIPAVRATRVPPIAAMREGALGGKARRGIVGPIIGGVVGLIGVGLLVRGLFVAEGVNDTLLSMAGGALLIFVGVAFSARFIVKPLAAFIGWPIERLFGGTARLARENAARNPARTASTSAALMIGVGLMVFVAVFAKGITDSFTGSLDRIVQGDLIIQGEGFQPVPAGSLEVIRGVAGVETVEPVKFTEVRIGAGGTNFMNGIDVGRATQVFGFDWQEGGGDELFGRLGQDNTVLEERFAESQGLGVGDRLQVTALGGGTRTFQVIGVYKDPILFSGFTVSEQAYDSIVTDPEPSIIVVEFADGTDAAAAQRAVEAALLTTFPTAEVRNNAEYKDEVESNVGLIRNLLYALLVLPVVISLFGIINTLVLAVFERTREIGMLRAIGTSRRQVRMMIRNESVITAVIGGVLGLIIGLFFGWIITKALEDEGISFAVPWLQLVLFLVLAIIAGIVAASLPARRAAKLDVLKALQYE